MTSKELPHRWSTKLLVVMLASGCAAVRPDARMMLSADTGSDSGNSSAGSGNSSAGSGNSSAGSANSSAGSGNSSNNSNNSSANSVGSSNNSNQSTANSAGSTGGKASQQSTAQSTYQSVQQTAASSVVVVSAGTLVLTVGGVGVALWAVLTRNHSAKAVAPAVEAFLRANEHQMKQDLAMGAGPFVEDLAAVAEVRREHRSQFGRLLHQHREELLSLSDPSRLDHERALLVLERIGSLAAEDPMLAEDGRQFIERHSHAG